ncbi:MAG: hypothetical protein DPW18_07005 [Chloroflexi bacterium]|nr:hypothetical protein [Chloroflexota bacterium]
MILADGSLQKWGEVSNQSSVNSDQSSAGGYQVAILSAVNAIRENYADAIQQNFPKSWRNSAGYRLNYLLPWSPSKPPQWTAGHLPPDTDHRSLITDHWSLTTDHWSLNTDHYPPIKPNTINLAPLLAGSEGTLAVIRRLKVNLVPKPKHTILGVLTYPGVAEACDDVPRLLAMNPSAVELIPRLILRNARSLPAYARQMGWVAGDPAAVLVVEFSGDQPPALKEAARRLGDVVTIAETVEEQSRIWNVRKVGLGILDSRLQSARPIAFIEDCAIPVERLGDFVREVERILTAHGTFGGIYAHASAGCLHIRPVLDLQHGEGVRAMRGIVEQVFALTMSLGGSMSSEHGDGLARGEFIERTYGREVTEAMRLLKRAADPHDILNPQKLFDAPPMDTNLRYGESYRAKAWTPVLHFEHERSLAGAIEQCNGQGVCRKTTGVMCPSFQATREEALSTRGRANLLRGLMLSSNIEYSNIRYSELEPAVFSALDLCLACKGCTSECPSGVDMPKLKYEFMNRYYKSHRRPLRDYLFGYFHVVAKWLSPIASLANLFMEMEWSRKLIARTLGIADQRPFPKFSRTRIKPDLEPGRTKSVIFLSDVFSHYIEPEVEESAIEILNALGYEVQILPVIGAGASLLSKGFLDAARKHAEKVLGGIQRLDGGAGLSVVGCEPPEVYCLKREYKSLLPKRHQEIESLAKRVWLVDEFILRAANLESFPLSLRERAGAGKKIILHPHCHQRAEGLSDDGLPAGVGATVAMLKMFGFDTEVVDAGCCGMAGTFGYDAGHYDLSMQVGELGVLPKIRQFAPSVPAGHLLQNRGGQEGVVVASTGAACRMQIQHGAGLAAQHPLALVRDRFLKRQ